MRADWGATACCLYRNSVPEQHCILHLNSGLLCLRTPEECAICSFWLRFLKHIYCHPKTTRLDISLLYIPASLDIRLLMLRGDLEQTSIYDSLKSQRI